MVVESKYLPDAEALHHHFAGTVCKGPCLILIEPLKYLPGCTLDLLTDMDNRQDAPCPHQVDRTLECHRACATDVVEEQGVTLVQDEIRDVEASALLGEFFLEAEGRGMVGIPAVFDRIPGAGINEYRVHQDLAFFAVQIPVMLGGSIWQPTWT